MHKYALRLQQESEARLAKGGDSHKATVVLMLFGAADAPAEGKKNADRPARAVRPAAKNPRKRS
jgi:hypothetical protein